MENMALSCVNVDLPEQAIAAADASACSPEGVLALLEQAYADDTATLARTLGRSKPHTFTHGLRSFSLSARVSSVVEGCATVYTYTFDVCAI